MPKKFLTYSKYYKITEDLQRKKSQIQHTSLERAELILMQKAYISEIDRLYAAFLS